MARAVTWPWLLVVALFGALTFAPTHSLLDSHFASGDALQTASWDATVSIEFAEELEEDTQPHSAIGGGACSILPERQRSVELPCGGSMPSDRRLPLRHLLRTNCSSRGPPVLS